MVKITSFITLESTPELLEYIAPAFLEGLTEKQRDALDRIDDPYDGIEIALVNMDTVVTYDAISGDATSISVAEFLESYLPEAINYEMAYI